MRYGSPPEELDVGSSYQMAAWDDGGRLRSQIVEARPQPECGLAGGTTARDGSHLGEPSLDRRALDAVADLAPWVLAAGALVGLGLALARCRTRQPA